MDIERLKGLAEAATPAAVVALVAENSELRAKLAAMESLKAEINKLEEKIKHAKSQEPIGSLYVNAAGHVFRMGRVIGPDFTPVYLDPLSAPESAPADKPPRITEQDAREIAGNVMEFNYDHKHSVDYWMREEGHYLLKKLNADREQVPVVAVPDGWREAVQEFVDRCEQGSIRSRYTYAKFKALLEAAPSHSQQSAEPEIEIVQNALEKTRLELRAGKDWILVCGEDGYSGDDALEVYYKDWAALLTWAKQTVADRCPSHESEQPDSEGE